MSIKKAPKPGRYKPSCTACKLPFALVIEEGEPPKVKIGKIADAKAADAKPKEDTARPLQKTPTPTAKTAIPNVDVTIEQPQQAVSKEQTQVTQLKADPKNVVTREIEATIESPSTSKTNLDVARSAVEATIDQPTQLANARDVEATLDSDSMHARAGSHDATFEAPKTKVAAKGEGDFSVDRAITAVPKGRTKIESKASGNEGVPDKLGGYRILKELGRGGMGSVYLAKQLSLDRKVALKTIQAAWANNPRVIARFIREAYAAAQLTHHNVVQIYDLGQDHGTNFFSMELVSGGSLDELLQKEGKLDPRTAASYVLQAARGLKFAHDHGMVHRDVKPANLMLSTESMVKVADLGLVKTSGPSDDGDTIDEDRSVLLASAHSKVTGAGSTMGTPAYMSPEQADDAASVDHRADIYSLGCTFYALLTGRPPFTSDSALDVITKHKTSKVERPDKVISGIPSDLGTIVEKMTAKEAADRYQDLDETIRDLERFLAGGATQSSLLGKQQADLLENASQAFRSAPAAKLRTMFPLVVSVGLVLLSVLCLLFSWKLATAFLVALIVTPIAIGVLSTIQLGANPIGSRVRASLMSSSIGDWLTWTLGLLFGVIVAYFLGLFVWWICGIIMACMLALVYQAVVQKPLNSQRESTLHQVEGMFKEMRLAGLEEKAIQRFVAEFSGKHWEELFETLFDYDAMRQARSALAADGRLKGRARFQSWRDWIVDSLEARIEKARQAKEQKMLAKLEQASLKAKGLSESEAKQQAEELAASMVSVASEARQAAPLLNNQTSEAAAVEKRERMKAMLQAARTGKPKTVGTLAKQTTGALLGHLLGGKLRFAVGAFMILGCLMWANQNDLLSKAHIDKISEAAQQAKKSVENIDVKNIAASGGELNKQMENVKNVKFDIPKTKPLQFPLIGEFFNSPAPGMMGLLILASSLIYGWRFSIFALPAAGVTLVTAVADRIPGLNSLPLATWIGFAMGLAILGMGMVIGRQSVRK